jgi:hypothetical protein
VHETSAELDELQRLLDGSDVRAGAHLRSIFTHDRRLTAAQVVEQLQGVFILHLATVNSSNEPIVAPVDGLFFHGRLWFGLPDRALRIRHLRRNPNVSAVYSVGESVCIMVHGVAREVRKGDAWHREYLEYCRTSYGARWFEPSHGGVGAGLTAFVDPRRAYAAGPRRDS